MLGSESGATSQVSHVTGVLATSRLLLRPFEMADVDLGYRLPKPYWGAGLATEAASAWIHAAFNQLRLKGLGAFVHPENIASVRMVDKLGFRAQRRDTILGMPSIYFVLEASETLMNR